MKGKHAESKVNVLDINFACVAHIKAANILANGLHTRPERTSRQYSSEHIYSERFNLIYIDILSNIQNNISLV